MKHEHTRSVAALLASLCCAALLTTGCITLRPVGAGQPQASTMPIHSTAGNGESETADQAVLKAVEEFLERTKEYQFTSPSPTEHPVPMPPSVVTASIGTGTRLGADVAEQLGPATPPPNSYALANTRVSLEAPEVTGKTLALPVMKRVWIQSLSENPPVPQNIKTKTTNEPLDTAPLQTTQGAEALLANLQKQAEQSGDFEAEWKLRLAQLALDYDEESVQVSSGLPDETARLMSSMVRVVTSLRRAARDPFSLADEALSRVDELREILSGWTEPSITAVVFCRKVVTFGVYEEMGPDSFVAGRGIRAIAYTEIKNFRSERNEDGQYQTRLATRLEVLTADGRSVWGHEESDIVDLCRRRRTDFFIAQRVSLPPTLPAGEYVLKVLVEDRLSGRASEASHTFEVNSPVSIATGS